MNRANILAALAAAFALAAAALFSGACRQGNAPPAPGDELAQLGAAVAAAQLTLPLARLACEALPGEGERQQCQADLDPLDDALRVAGGVVRTGETCRASGEAACLTSALDEARRLLPLLTRAPGAPPAASSSAAPAPASAVSRLRALAVVGKTLAPIGAAACTALPAPGDQASCQGTLAALRTALGLAQGALAAADQCTAADAACLDAAEDEARRQLPELERLAVAVEALARSQPVSSDPYAARDILRQMRPAASR